ncbi:MAG: chemotaxis protein CheX [Leptospiraceae bacterium]|nr:chemotaxis protein CheX [Leptospiraceae bacterium]
MKQEELQTIADTAKNYFREVSGEVPEIGIPFILRKKESVLELTGLIGISGNRRGCIYISSERLLVKELTKCILQMDEVDDSILYDMVGELSNTICGNICQSFGNDFNISVPIVISGVPDELILQKLSQPIYVIPVLWRNSKCLIVAGID